MSKAWFTLRDGSQGIRRMSIPIPTDGRLSVVLGRAGDKACDFVVQDSVISRQHARVMVGADLRVHVEDLQSTGGTFCGVSGGGSGIADTRTRLAPGTCHTMSPGDVVYFGAVQLSWLRFDKVKVPSKNALGLPRVPLGEVSQTDNTIMKPTTTSNSNNTAAANSSNISSHRPAPEGSGSTTDDERFSPQPVHQNGGDGAATTATRAPVPRANTESAPHLPVATIADTASARQRDEGTTGGNSDAAAAASLANCASSCAAAAAAAAAAAEAAVATAPAAPVGSALPFYRSEEVRRICAAAKAFTENSEGTSSNPARGGKGLRQALLVYRGKPAALEWKVRRYLGGNLEPFQDKAYFLRVHAGLVCAAVQCEGLLTRRPVTLHRIFSRPQDRRRCRTLPDFLHGQLMVAQRASENREYLEASLARTSSRSNGEGEEKPANSRGARGGPGRDERLITFEVEAGVPLFPTSLTPEEFNERACEWEVLLPPVCLAQYDVDHERGVVRVRSTLLCSTDTDPVAAAAANELLGM